MNSNEAIDDNVTTRAPRRMSGLRILLLVLLVAVVTSAVTVWLTTTYLFPKEFKPVQLSEGENRALEAKIARLDTTVRPSQTPAPGSGAAADTEALAPKPYREDAASRRVVFSERELNALLAKNTDLARKLAVDLSADLASARLLVPLDPDFPILGGKTLKLSAGLELRYAEGRPIVVLRGISLWGVPLPNAWLGGIKNVDLVREFGGGGGFWQAFSEGVADVRVEEGQLSITLRE